MDSLSILSININFSKHRVTIYVHTSIFTCAHYLFCGELINNSSPWKLSRPNLNLSNVSNSMEINDPLPIFKDSISREISELTNCLEILILSCFHAGDLATAVRKTDIHFGLYHSLFEWYNPLFLQDRDHLFQTRNYVQVGVDIIWINPMQRRAFLDVNLIFCYLK